MRAGVGGRPGTEAQRGASVSDHPGQPEGEEGDVCAADPAGDGGGGRGGGVLLRRAGPALPGSLGLLSAQADAQLDRRHRTPRRRDPLVLSAFTLAGEDAAGLKTPPPAGRGSGRQVREGETNRKEPEPLTW